jgi:zinc protease
MIVSIKLNAPTFTKSVCFLLALSSLTAGNVLGQNDWNPLGKQPDASWVHLDTLENGLRLVTLETPEMERVHWSIQIEAPQKLEKERGGVAKLTGELMRSGTDSLDSVALDVLLEQYDAAIYTADGILHASCPREHAQATLKLMAQVLRYPDFSPSAFAAAVERHQQQFKVASQDFKIRSQELALQQIFTKKHPHGERITPATLDSISREDLVHHHANWYRPQFAGIAVQGPISSEESVAWVGAALGDWLPREIPRTRHNPPAQPMQNRVCFGEVSGEDRLALSMAHVVRLKPGHQDVAACLVMNALLTHPKLPGRLVNPDCNSPKCSSSGISSVLADPMMGHFQLNAIAEPHELVPFIEQSLQTMRELTLDRVDEDWVQLAVEAILTDISKELQDPQKNLDAWLDALLRRNDTAGPAGLISALRMVRSADVQRVAIHHLRPSNLVIAVAGDLALIPSDLVTLSGTDEIEFYDALGNRQWQLDPAPDGYSAETVFSQYYDARGGSDGFETLHSLIQKGQINDGSEMALIIEVSTEFGRGHVMQVSLDGQIMWEQLVTDTIGISRQMGQSKALKQSEYQRLKHNLYSAPYLHLADLNQSAQLLGVDRDALGPHYVVEIQSEGMHKETLYFHSQTHWLVKSVGERTGPTGPVKITTTFSDYQTSKGLAFPMTIVQVTNGQSMTFHLNEVIPNGRIPSNLFELN